MSTPTSIIFSLLLVLGTFSASTGTAATLQSPDQRLSLQTEFKDGTLSYSLSRDDKPFLLPSPLGLQWANEVPKWKSSSTKSTSHSSTWTPVWGKHSSITNTYNEAIVTLSPPDPKHISLSVIFRLYDEGLAFRYQFHASDSSPKNLTIHTDLSTYTFAQDGSAWSYNGERENKGPELLSGLKEKRRLPMTISFVDGGFATMTEAHLENFSWSDLKPQSAERSFSFAPEKSTIPIPFETPWRVLIIGDQPGDLIDASILENLNPPCAIQDPSWVDPGVTFWDWRTWGYKAPDGFEYGLDMASWRRFIDFASESGTSHILLDANWYGPEFDPKENPTTSRDHLVKQLPNGHVVREPAPDDWADPIDIPALIKYGKERNVGIFLYINDKARINFDFEETLATYQKWGAAGIKYGFMAEKNRQKKVNQTNEIIRLCAKYQLMCNFHDGPVPPSGDYRTWPNCTTREFCHAQADAKRSFVPTTFHTSIFCNMVTGPIDMGNGMFALNEGHKFRPRVFQPIPSTIVGECARTLITFSGQSIVLDAPESFGAHPDLFAFIGAQKQPWQESKTIDGKIGEFIVMRRTAADGTILLAATTNEEPREIKVPLNFLGKGTFKATILQDTSETNYTSNRESHQIETRTLNSAATLTLKLAPGGGACVTFHQE